LTSILLRRFADEEFAKIKDGVDVYVALRCLKVEVSRQRQPQRFGTGVGLRSHLFIQMRRSVSTVAEWAAPIAIAIATAALTVRLAHRCKPQHRERNRETGHGRRPFTDPGCAARVSPPDGAV
jgi:hypothetical protein